MDVLDGLESHGRREGESVQWRRQISAGQRDAPPDDRSRRSPAVAAHL